MLDIIPPALTIISVLVVLSCLWTLCHGVIPFTPEAKRRKLAKTVLGAARTFILSNEDLPAYTGDTLEAERLRTLRDAWQTKDVATCKDTLELLDQPKSFAMCREWLDIFVVSISVAMAFRAYFYEPFHIPTGSMQPTLYGNHTIACKGVEAPSFWYTTPGLRWYTWLVTGRMYESFTAPFSGTLVFGQTNTGHYDMRVCNKNGVISKPMLVPTDVLHPGETGDGPYRQTALVLPNGIIAGSDVEKGRSLWRGYVCSGDFLFVNRWLWNFRHPKRGDVMIFNTTGIAERNGTFVEAHRIASGTHYIKRMTGIPGERLELVPKAAGRDECELLVNGVRPMEPERIAQIQNQLSYCPDKEPAYAGYLPGPRIASRQVLQLGADEYWACGDNSRSSLDSRYWGPVPANKLCGIAGGVFWPFTHRWGSIR